MKIILRSFLLYCPEGTKDVPYTMYSRIEAQASIFFLASKRGRHLNGTGVYLCSTVLAPGRMSAHSAARLFIASLCHFYRL
jgi:hypothetical protein